MIICLQLGLLLGNIIKSCFLLGLEHLDLLFKLLSFDQILISCVRAWKLCVSMLLLKLIELLPYLFAECLILRLLRVDLFFELSQNLLSLLFEIGSHSLTLLIDNSHNLGLLHVYCGRSTGGGCVWLLAACCCRHDLLFLSVWCRSSLLCIDTVCPHDFDLVHKQTLLT